MKRLAIALMFLAVPALAQSRYPSREVVANDFMRMEQSVAQLYRELERLTVERAMLDQYLKQCGDKPGCTQPVGKE